jgi:hypothetical protein
LQVFDSRFPSDPNADLAQRDFVWGDTTGSTATYTTHYFPYAKDPESKTFSTSGAGDGPHDYAWYEANHPDWMEYTCDFGKPQTPTGLAYYGGKKFHYTSSSGASYGYVTVDFSNPLVEKMFLTDDIKPVAGGSYKGIGFDNFAAYNMGTIMCGIKPTPTTWQPQYSGQRVDPAFETAVTNWLDWMEQHIHALGMSVTINHHYSKNDPAGFDRVAAHADIVIDEDGMVRNCQPTFLDSDWTNYFNAIRKITTERAFAMVEDSCPLASTSHALRSWQVANYLLYRGDRSYLAITDTDNDGMFVDIPELKIKIGAPTGDPQQSGSAWMRTYANGIAIVNPSSTSSATITLPSGITYKDFSGKTWSNSITVDPASAAVLLAQNSGDTTPPSVSLTTPTSGATVSGTTNITASASDNVGVAGVQFRLDGIALATDTAAPYTYSWNTTQAVNGTHTLVAVAHDAAGKYATSTESVVVSNVASPSSGWQSATNLLGAWRGVNATAGTGSSFSVIESSTSTPIFHYFQQYITTPAYSNWRLSFDVKPIGNRSANMFVLDSSSESTAYIGAICNLTNQGMISDLRNGASAGVPTATVSLASGGWYHCSLAGTVNKTPDAGLRLVVRLVNGNGADYYQGDGVSGLAVQNVTLEVNPLVVPPTASPAPGTYSSAQNVALAATNSSSIRYTLDGSTPSCTTSTLYSGPIHIASSATINAIACNDTHSSSVASFGYVILTATVYSPAPQPTVTLTASPTSITSGGSATLTWSSTNASSCTGNGFSTAGSGASSGGSYGGATSGSATVYPTVTTTYSVSCTNGTVSAASSATVTVTSASTGGTVTSPYSTPPSATLIASPTSITSGGSATLTWSSANASSCTGNGFSTAGSGASSGGSFDGATSGSVTVSPTQTTTYSVSCKNGLVSAVGSATVTVVKPPSVSLTASPTSITSGGSATLTWSSTNATSCTGNGFSAGATSGSASVSPTQTTTYSVSCTNGTVSAASSATVTVTTPPPVA